MRNDDEWDNEKRSLYYGFHLVDRILVNHDAHNNARVTSPDLFLEWQWRVFTPLVINLMQVYLHPLPHCPSH